MATVYDRLRPRSETALRAETLLTRYPNLSEPELAELINLFPTLRSVDQMVLTANGRLSGKFADFHREHSEELKMPRAERIAFVAIPAVLGILALWWALV